MQRRTLLKLASMTAAHSLPSLGLLGCDTQTDPAADESLFLGGFLTSLTVEHDYQAKIVGTLPADLTGTLYRNGPGLFERDGVRKNTLVDGDGMVNAYFFTGDGNVRFKNRFTQTVKFVEEEAAGRYLYDTWTTKAPDAADAPNIINQAGVSVWKHAGKLLAFDEGAFPYELDPNTLETIGLNRLGFEDGETTFNAHPKILPGTGEFATFGIDFTTGQLHLTVLDAAGAVVERIAHPMAPATYVHDFFATPSHLIVALQPVELELEPLFSGSSVWESFAWRPELGMRWLVFERGTGAPPVEIEGPAHWMWHGANAYLGSGGELICDWAAYADPFHFLGKDAEFAQLMQGREVVTGARAHLRRTVLDPAKGTLSEEVLMDEGHVEFPGVDRNVWGQQHAAIYSSYNPRGTALWNGVMRLDTKSGKTDVFDFGADHICGEPLFAPRPGGKEGWILAEVSNAQTSRAFLAIFDAARLADGPVAQVQLEHHLPIRFHGHWVGGA